MDGRTNGRTDGWMVYEVIRQH